MDQPRKCCLTLNIDPCGCYYSATESEKTEHWHENKCTLFSHANVQFFNSEALAQISMLRDGVM